MDKLYKNIKERRKALKMTQQELNPEYSVLFKASANVRPEDIDLVTKFIEKSKSSNFPHKFRTAPDSNP